MKNPSGFLGVSWDEARASLVNALGFAPWITRSGKECGPGKGSPSLERRNGMSHILCSVLQAGRTETSSWLETSLDTHTQAPAKWEGRDRSLCLWEGECPQVLGFSLHQGHPSSLLVFSLRGWWTFNGNSHAFSSVISQFIFLMSFMWPTLACVPTIQEGAKVGFQYSFGKW